LNILEEANAVVKDRQAAYGSPVRHWGRTVALVNAHFGTRFAPEDWGVIMVFDKLARQLETDKRDNLVDVCGYAAGVQSVIDSRNAFRYQWDDETGEKTMVQAK